MGRNTARTVKLDRRDEVEGEDLASVPPEMRLSRDTVLTAAGARTLMAELDESKRPSVGERLRALVRGLRA